MSVHEKTRYRHIRLCLYRVVELFLPLYGFHTCTAMLANVCHNAKNILEATCLFTPVMSGVVETSVNQTLIFLSADFGFWNDI